MVISLLLYSKVVKFDKLVDLGYKNIFSRLIFSLMSLSARGQPAQSAFVHIFSLQTTLELPVSLGTSLPNLKLLTWWTGCKVQFLLHQLTVFKQFLHLETSQIPQ